MDEEISKEKVNSVDISTLYVQRGHIINRFLRSGEFYNFKFIDKEMPNLNKEKSSNENIYKYVMSIVSESKEFYRQLIDGIPKIDEMTYSSRTTSPMKVYRDAPESWLETAKNGILTDDAFCSTSTIPGGSMESIFFQKSVKRYVIELPENTPFWDLTENGEYEMLLPRGSQFEILENGNLKFIGIKQINR